jgi:hypothetical protein
MKKHYAIICVASLLTAPNLFAAWSYQALGSYVDNGNITLVDNTGLYSYGNGGEFRAVGDSALQSAVDWSAYSSATKGTMSDSTDGGSWGYGSGLAQNGTQYFQTFCTELNEEFSPGDLYSVSSIGNAALYDHTGNPVPINQGVAYLYSYFAQGTLYGYNYAYGSGRSTSAGILQNAIWYLLGEGGYLNSGSFVYNDLLGKFGSIANAQTAAGNGQFGVADMVLSEPGYAQDQLVMIGAPIGPQAIPVPEVSTVFAGALMLLPLGVSALRIVRRNRVA